MSKTNQLTITLSLFAFTASTAVAAPPSWVDGRDSRFTNKEFVIGVGTGSSADVADNEARAEVARVFESKVQSVFTDFQKSASVVNSSGKGVSIEVQQVERFNQVTTQKTLSGVRIEARATDNGLHYSLALLERGQCVRSLTSEIQTFDAKIISLVQAASGGDKVKAFRSYGKAMNIMDEREAKNAMLRVCDKDGRGIRAPIGLGELAAKFDEASGDLKLGVIVDGSGAERVRDCIMEKLGDKGYEISELRVDDEDEDEDDDTEADEKLMGGYDVILKGKLRSEKAGEVAGSKLVRTSLTLRLINGKTKKVLKTFRGTRKEGRRSIKASAALAAHKICKKNVSKIVKAIDKYFKR